MEKNLSYGDCFNFLGAIINDLLGANKVEKSLDEKQKNN